MNWEYPFYIFVSLIFAHSLTDLALQPDHIGLRKNRLYHHIRFDGSKIYHHWPYYLVGHGLINGTGVWLVTTSVTLGLAESLAHSIIDFTSCERWIPFWLDQVLHVFCKVAWVFCWITWYPL